MIFSFFFLYIEHTQNCRKKKKKESTAGLVTKCKICYNYTASLYLSESDVVCRVSRLPPWPPSRILELNNLAILNLHVTPVPPIKFRLNLTYCLGGDVVCRISRWWTSWTLQQNAFSNSEFP